MSDTADRPAPPRHGPVAAGVITLIVATLIAYLPAIAGGGFIWDDDDYLTKNRALEADDALRRIWTTHETPQYYPVVFTSFWIERSIWGLDPVGFHLVNVLLHAANALLAWRLARRLGVPAGWLVGALFALHPLTVESVAWITERKNVLSGLFYLLAALGYLRFELGPDEGRSTLARTAWYGAALVLFALAVLSKSVTCSLPAALVLALLWLRRPLTWPRLLPLGPMLLIGIAAAWNTSRLEVTKVGAEGADFDWSIVERVLIASRALLFYPSKLIVPWPLSFIYPRWTIDAASLAQWVPVAVVLAAAAGLVVLYRRGVRGPGLAVAFYAGTVFPALGFFNVYPHLFSFVADHFAYLALLGLITPLAAGYGRLVRSPSRRLLYAAPVLVLLMALTWMRSAVYRDAETVWRDTIASNPEAWMVRNNLSSLLLRQVAARINDGMLPEPALLEEAREQAAEAARLRPQHHTARANLSEALRLQGRLDEAVEHALEARELAPHLWDYHYQAGRLLQQLGRHDEAVAAYRDALQLVRPGGEDEATVQFELGRLLFQIAPLDEAEPPLLRFAEIHPRDFLAESMLGEIALSRGDDAQASQRFALALAVAATPQEQLKVGYRLALLMASSPDAKVRDGSGALWLAERMVEYTHRQSPHLLEALAAAHAETGDFAAAVQAAEEGLQLARAQKAAELVGDLERELEDYRAGLPYRRGQTGAGPAANDLPNDE